MILSLIAHILKLNSRDEFISKINIVLELIAIFISLLIYYFTSKTFSGSIDSSLAIYKVNYFDFILIGEVLLALPLFFLEGTYRKVRESLMNGVYDTFNYLGISSLKSIFFLVSSALPKVLFRISLTLVFAYLFFGFSIPIGRILICFLIVIISLPLFFSFGLAFSAVLLKTGRGQALIGYFLTMMSIGAGGFFPLSVLPVSLVRVLEFFPYTTLLETLRLFLVDANYSRLSDLVPALLWFLLIPFILLGFKKVTRNQTSESIILK